MDIGTEQVFLLNSTDLIQHEPNPLQQAFRTPAAVMEPGDEPEIINTYCLPQNNMTCPPPRTQMCRLCATVTGMVMPIFEGEGLRNNLADKIHQHLPIQVSQNDILPVVVCFECASTLMAWHELVVCSVQADNAMRERFNLAVSQQQQQEHLHIAASQSQIKEDKSQELTKIINNVLAEYFHFLNMEDSSQVELVCQKCTSQPSLITEDFAPHLIAEHYSEVPNKDAVQTFIRDHVTFEEALEEFVGDIDSDPTEELQVERKPLPTLLCPYCESAFSSTTRLVHHLNTHMEISMESGVECCSVLYSTRKDFVAHLQDKHVARAVSNQETTCRSCGFTAESAELLRSHVMERHGDPKRGKKRKESALNQKSIPAVCPECNKTFSNKYSMFFHMKSHSGREAHRCDACGKRYSTRGNLAQHARLAHQGRLPHACAHCGERFPARAPRDLHQRLHSGARPFRCEECGQRFRAGNSLARHADMHRDRRPHACRECGRAFRQRSHLAHHARTHR